MLNVLFLKARECDNERFLNLLHYLRSNSYVSKLLLLSFKQVSRDKILEKQLNTHLLYGQKRAGCNKSIDKLQSGLLSSRYQGAFASLVRFVSYPQAQYKLFQQLAVSLQTPLRIKFNLHRLDVNQQASHTLSTNIHEASKFHNLYQVCGVSDCV